MLRLCIAAPLSRNNKQGWFKWGRINFVSRLNFIVFKNNHKKGVFSKFENHKFPVWSGRTKYMHMGVQPNLENSFCDSFGSPTDLSSSSHGSIWNNPAMGHSLSLLLCALLACHGTMSQMISSMVLSLIVMIAAFVLIGGIDAVVAAADSTSFLLIKFS